MTDARKEAARNCSPSGGSAAAELSNEAASVGAQKAPQPLAGLRVVEFTHMVMGPTCGMMLADMGAEVIKIEPIDGDRTRRLLGAGAGFFPMFNRNKKSIAIDLRKPEGAQVARKLAASADVVAENFKPGTMAKYGLDYPALAKVNPRLTRGSCPDLTSIARRSTRWCR
jgi:crotonobetainyl-CoA:carnitine CoA-transferase CaiB-like acyl-CoA transferase